MTPVERLPREATPVGANSLDVAEAAVHVRSEALRKDLSLRDLVFAQILFIVGLQWVGVAAKLGPSHVIFWLIAVGLFNIPSAGVAVWLNRVMSDSGAPASVRRRG